MYEHRYGCVAFRLDDVQDFYHSNLQIAILDLFRQEHAKITAGIISNAFGKDTTLVEYIKDAVKDEVRSIVRVANHGWNHEDMTRLNKNDQSQVIKQSNQRICEFLATLPSVFIPPYSMINDDTILALRENNIKYISSSIKHDPPPYNFQRSAPYRFPVTVSTSYTFFNKYWYKLTNDKIITNVQNSVMRYGFAVVLIHPQQYATTKRKSLNTRNKGLINLRLLIEGVRNNGLDIITIEEIKRYIDQY
jgi:peptidoglycan/xylan/chitin deacetylase (PgdA/CDA1 family)